MSPFSSCQFTSPDQPRVSPRYSDLAALEAPRPANPLQAWFSECVSDALALIERRAASFRYGHTTLTTIQDHYDRAKRYQLIDSILSSPSSLADRSGREVLQNIIAGYLHEFSRQTILGVPPLNIANPARPQPLAQAFWESRPSAHFERHRFPGVHHTAQSYLGLVREQFHLHSDRGTRTGRKAAWDATSELLRAAIDTFRARGSEVFPDRELRASIYNDHLYVLAHARRNFCAKVEALRQVA
jgi:hypothetical protein